MDYAGQRLSDQEQQELLAQAVELRRITNIEKDLALQTYTLNPSQLSVCRKAGYGDDLHALDTAVSVGHKAREKLVTGNMGLVHYCVNTVLGKKKATQNLSREDLVQEGSIGLARAVDKWNPEIGGKFSTYAYYWIRAAVFRCIAEHDDLVRVPEHVSAAVRKMTKACQKLGIDIDGDNILSTVYSSTDSNWKEAQAAKALAEEAGLTDRQLFEAMKVQQRRRSGIMSFESWMQKGIDYETDLISASQEEGVGMPSTQAEDLKKTLGRFLRPKELEALSWRYGLIQDGPKPRNYVAEAEEELFGSSSRPGIPVRGKGGEAMSFVEVGKKMEVSGEYVRRLCHAALGKLRRAAEEGALIEPALSF